MARNEWADRFIDCVVKRTERDAMPKTNTIVLLMVIPAAFSIIIATTLLTFHADLFPTDVSAYISVVMGMMLECGIAGFVLFSLANRSRTHIARDTEWMDSLIGFVESHGADGSAMKAIRDEMPMRGWMATLVSAIAWIAIMVMTVGVGVAIARGTDPLTLTNWILYVYLVLMAQFVFTLGYTSRFPARHDDIQCRFTEALSKECSGFGMNVEPLEPSVRRTHWAINVVLFVITLGLYTFVLLLLSNYHTNKHMASQWRYESKLMITIIRFEGGIGVEGYGCNQPENRFIRIISNIM